MTSRFLDHIRAIPRAKLATLLLVTLLAGSLAHGWHHFSDRDCESPSSHGSDTCTECRGLHSVPLPEVVATTAEPLPRPVEKLAPASEASPLSEAVTSTCARAPPAA
ncbi:MAG: hypothetical protein HOP12_08390 [Candidatus Eisenbacteria bacterium]|uniref:DUF2946 domain-containing protein n=1 Tax=Eiseniibacteriota bacterium TaxID=2212470 RepID=A0A849SIB8_UNCEI|nr:hypothetical protein [Candidatus Eisenbacteria bacterium]